MNAHGLTEAQRLTKAERRAVLQLPADGTWAHGGFGCSDCRKLLNGHPDLIRRQYCLGGAGGLIVVYKLSPAGIALRAKLDAEAGR